MIVFYCLFQYMEFLIWSWPEIYQVKIKPSDFSMSRNYVFCGMTPSTFNRFFQMRCQNLSYGFLYLTKNHLLITWLTRWFWRERSQGYKVTFDKVLAALSKVNNLSWNWPVTEESVLFQPIFTNEVSKSKLQVFFSVQWLITCWFIWVQSRVMLSNLVHIFLETIL